MTADAFAAHQAGLIRAVEVRGSDYMGAGPGDYAHVPRVIAKALQGKTVGVLGSTDQPHTWTDIRDMGRALATVATEESAWGRVWHAPSNPPRTQAEAINDVLASVGAKPVTVRAMPNVVLTIAAPFVPILRELRETLYQFTSPYVMDSSAITAAFGLEPDAVGRGLPPHRALEDRAAGRDFHGGNTPCVQHQEPIAVSTAQHAGVLRQRSDDVVDNFVFAPRIALLVRDIHAVTADEPDTKHKAFHVYAH